MKRRHTHTKKNEKRKKTTNTTLHYQWTTMSTDSYPYLYHSATTPPPAAINHTVIFELVCSSVILVISIFSHKWTGGKIRVNSPGTALGEIRPLLITIMAQALTTQQAADCIPRKKTIETGRGIRHCRRLDMYRISIPGTEKKHVGDFY